MQVEADVGVGVLSSGRGSLGRLLARKPFIHDDNLALYVHKAGVVGAVVLHQDVHHHGDVNHFRSLVGSVPAHTIVNSPKVVNH